MIRRNETWILGVATLLACLLVPATAGAFTHSIEDIEDPAVHARVLSLEVRADRSLTNTQYCTYSFCPSPAELSTESWSHSLEGNTGGELIADQFPALTVDHAGGLVSLSGELTTVLAAGNESYQDFELCSSSRTTTASERLEVRMDGFYQPGNSPSSGNPSFSLTTENEDPWMGFCNSGAIDTSTRPTRIDLFSTSGTSGASGSWHSTDGELATTSDGCTADHCDFTITGRNTNASYQYSGEATGTFTLKLRLEYPSDELDTRITKGVPKVIRTRRGKTRVSFAFASNGPQKTRFRCRLDRRKPTRCSSPFVAKVGPGRHRFAVFAVYRGQADMTPASRNWRVVKK